MAAPSVPAQTSGRVTTSFDADWRFVKADAAGAELPGFDDHAWRQLDVPHDWSIEGPFAATNSTGGAGGFLPAGVGWYRKCFTLSETDSKRRFFIEFDGVMANSQVWINGWPLGNRPSGYVSFRYELTGHIEFGPGKTNVIAVRADNSRQPASRWYTGAGIYRHVRLVSTDPIHLEGWSTFVTTPQISDDAAVVRVHSSVINQSASARDVALQVVLLNPAGKRLQTARTEPLLVVAGASAEFECEQTVRRPQRWDLERPALYHAVVKVVSAGAFLDSKEIPFGIRQFKFEPETGFWLNGQNLKLKGVCLHHEAGGLGAAVPLAAWERRLTVLKAIGCNAIRTSHNPVAPEFLDLCDRMGFIVMDEMFDCWTVAKNPYDYHLFFNEWSKSDVRDTVRRDRNHPSIVIYSAGNEIHDTPKAELAKSILRGLVETFHENDPTRPVTQALFRPNVSHDYEDGLADLLDVVGQNYRENEILAAHRAKPGRKILGTENTHEREVWLALRDNPPYAGQFLWTGIDYLGESRRWPMVGHASGLLDRTATPRPVAFERESWWSSRPMVRIVRREAPTELMPSDPGYGKEERYRPVLFCDWTPRSSGPHKEQVEIFSNCEQVELFLNGESLGAEPLPGDGSPRTWQVPFQPGIIKAIGRNQGRVAATHALRTAGKPAKILLTTDHPRLAPTWDAVAYVKASVVDDSGELIPNAGDTIHFSLSGPGVIAAVDSGDNSSHEAFQASERRAFNGVCFAILKAKAASGRLILAASATGLKPASTTIKLIACSPAPPG